MRNLRPINIARGALIALCVVADIAQAGGTVITQPVGQVRITGTCAAGSSIRVVNADGTVTCETDDTGGITNSAGVNVIPKSDGVNLIASGITDTGSLISIVASNSSSNIVTIKNTHATGYSALDFIDETGTDKLGVGYSNSADVAYVSMNGTDLLWTTTGNVQRLRFFQSTGNINIGATTSDPSALLRVEGSTKLGTSTSHTHTIVGNTSIAGVNSGTPLNVSSTNNAIIRVQGDSDNASSDSGYSGFVVARGNTPTELWFIGRNGTGNNDGLIFRRGATTDSCTLSTSDVLNCIGGLQVNGSNVGLASSIAGTAGKLPKFATASTLGDSTLADDGAGTITSTSRNFKISTSAASAPQIQFVQSGQTEWDIYQPASGSGLAFFTNGSDRFTLAASNGNANFTGTLTTQAQLSGYAGLSGVSNVTGLALGNAVSSTTSADTGFAVGLDRNAGTVYLDTKLGAGSLNGRIGGTTNAGTTNTWLTVDASGNVTHQKNVSVGGNTALGDAVTDTTTIKGTTAIWADSTNKVPLALINDTNTLNYGFQYGGPHGGSNSIIFRYATGAQSAWEVDTNGKLWQLKDMQIDGGATIGDSTTADSHTINGFTTATGGNGAGDTFTINKTTTAATANSNAITGSTSGTYDATGGARLTIAVNGSATATRSAGAFNVTNVALSGDANGGQVNTALRTLRGDVSLNETSGTTTIHGNTTIGDTSTNTLGVNGYTGIGIAPSSTVQLKVDGSSRTNAIHAIGATLLAASGTLDTATINYTGTLQTRDTKALIVSNSGSVVATGANRVQYGLYATSTGTESSGDSNTTNYAIYAMASGGDNNYAAFLDGDVKMASGAKLSATNLVINTGGSTLTFCNDSACSATFAGNSGLTVNGNTVIGDAGTDTLTVNAATTHAGTSTFNNTFTTTTTTNIGNSSDDAITFSNGPRGVNGYGGRTYEFTDDWLYRSLNASMSANGGLMLVTGGTGANSTGPTLQAAAGRPGLWAVTTGTTATGRAGFIGLVDGNQFQNGEIHRFRWIGGFPTVSSATEGYAAWIGYSNAATSLGIQAGCGFLYDERVAATAPATGSQPAAGTHTLSIRCADTTAGNSTQYPLNGSATDDLGATVGNVVVGALTWPSTNVLDLEVVYTDTVKAEFYVAGTKVGTITTHLPSGSGATHQAGPMFQIFKSVGTTARTMEWDFTSVGYTLSANR